MAKSGTDKFTTTVILTAKCGTKVSAALFMKKLGDAGYSSVETFLNDNESKILSKSFGKQQRNKFFPKSLKSINREEWDLQVYCFLLLEICCLNNTEYRAIEYLRKKRNKLSHRSKPSLNDEQYEKYTERIRNIIEDLLEIINDEQLKKEVMYDLETALRSGTSEFQDEFVKILHNWYSDIHSRLDEVETNIENSISGVGNGIKVLGDGVNGLTIGQQTMMKKLDHAVSLLESEDATPVKIPGTEIQILVKNCSSEKEKVICKVLADLFKEKIRNEPVKADLAGLSEQTVDNLRVVVAEVFQELVSKGIKIIDVEQKCVLLKVDCTSFKVLKELINECADKRMTAHFQPVEQVVKEIPGCESCSLQTVLTEDEFWECMDKLVFGVQERSLLSRGNTYRTTENVAVSHNNEADSFRIQLAGESLQAESENDLFRSELNKMQTTVQREFELPGVYLEKQILKKEILTETQPDRKSQCSVAGTNAETSDLAENIGSQSQKSTESSSSDVAELTEHVDGMSDDVESDSRMEHTRRPNEVFRQPFKPISEKMSNDSYGSAYILRKRVRKRYLVIVIMAMIFSMMISINIYHSQENANRLLHMLVMNAEANNPIRMNDIRTYMKVMEAKANDPFMKLADVWVHVFPAMRAKKDKVLLFVIPRIGQEVGTFEHVSKNIITSLNEFYNSNEDEYTYSRSLNCGTQEKKKSDVDEKLVQILEDGKAVILDHIDKLPVEFALHVYRYGYTIAHYKSDGTIIGWHLDSVKRLDGDDMINDFNTELYVRGLSEHIMATEFELFKAEQDAMCIPVKYHALCVCQLRPKSRSRAHKDHSHKFSKFRNLRNLLTRTYGSF